MSWTWRAICIMGLTNFMFWIMKRHFFVRAAMIFAAFSVALLATSCIIGPKNDGSDRVKIGDPVPTFSVTDSYGVKKTFSQADFVGKRSVIIFFATWCPDCRREMPIVYEAWKKLSQYVDFQIIAISREETADAVKKYWDEESESKPAYTGMAWWLDSDKSAFSSFADSYVPRIYLVNTRGEIAQVAVEKFDMTAERIVELINLLK